MVMSHRTTTFILLLYLLYSDFYWRVKICLLFFGRTFCYPVPPCLPATAHVTAICPPRERNMGRKGKKESRDAWTPRIGEKWSKKDRENDNAKKGRSRERHRNIREQKIGGEREGGASHGQPCAACGGHSRMSTNKEKDKGINTSIVQ